MKHLHVSFRATFYLFFIIGGIILFTPLFRIEAQATPQDVVARRTQLEHELSVLEKEIEVQTNILLEKQRESVSLERDIAILNARIQSAELSIRARDIAIRGINSNIAGKEDVITGLEEKINREKASLSELLRKTHEIDQYSLVEVILAGKNLSAFFRDIDSFDSIKTALGDSFKEIEDTKLKTQDKKNSLLGKRREEEELKQLQVLQKRRTEEDKTEKNKILKITKGQEAEYQKIIKNQEKDAAVIKAELFTLRGTDAIPFEKALEFANIAFAKTGVRPAFLLGVIAEESNLGENVGTGNWQTDMHPTRDRPVFEEIVRRLGLFSIIDTLPVSKKPWYGWGGAMGPAQFIPSTWKLYENKIANLTGHNSPNPWDPYDAFIAAAVLLKENGAAKGGYAAERLAALRYFAGWNNAAKSAYAFYGDDVMALATKYQGLIDILRRS